ncbi:MAG TPA: hypothetical protein VFU22_13470 [Roseiflexaceae bacterium]|nr:hypothetical protein [Roseiflexaceae bacterium]
MFQVAFQQVRLRFAAIALLQLLAACGTAETGRSPGAPAAQPTSGPGATVAPTTAPTKGSGGSATGPTGTTTVVASQGGPVNDQVSLLDALRNAGANVQLGDTVEQPFLSVSGTLLTVNGADVQVFEFADTATAKDAVGQLGPDGNPPTMMIEWVAPPHFYQAGRIVALYVGEDQAITEALTQAMGAQLAGR